MTERQHLSSEGSSGLLGFTLQPVTGASLTSVHYVVTKAGLASPVAEGDFPTPGSGNTFTFGLPLPVGSGYSVSLSAVAVESATTTCVGAFGPVDVLPNKSTNLNLVLACTDGSTGSALPGVTVTTDACPRVVVDFVGVSPTSAQMSGGKMALIGSARELDGKSLTYSWSIAQPAVGSFAPMNRPSTIFTCKDFGLNVPVTLTASNGECQSVINTFLSCLDATCGNGVLDPGESCDPSIPGAQPGCLTNCRLPVCGDGIVESPFETCDPVPADPNNCRPDCTIRFIECGDGFLEAGEPCDGTLFAMPRPAGASCRADCTLASASIDCGNGIIEGNEVCDPGFTKENCGRDCLSITSARCSSCEAAGNACLGVSCDSVGGTAAVGSPAAGVARSTLCNEVLDCVRDSGCAAGGAPTIKCYCGTANNTACSAGQGNGACKAQIERGLETIDFNTIAARIGNTVFGAAKALNRIECDQTFCDTPGNSECF